MRVKSANSREEIKSVCCMVKKQKQKNSLISLVNFNLLYNYASVVFLNSLIVFFIYTCLNWIRVKYLT